jgi:hypothetical protein
VKQREPIEVRYFGAQNGADFDRAWDELWARVDEQNAEIAAERESLRTMRAETVKACAEFTD